MATVTRHMGNYYFLHSDKSLPQYVNFQIENSKKLKF